jgi:hypothetical protein
MVVALWFLAIPTLCLILYRIHCEAVSCRAYRRYDQLKLAVDNYQAAWNECWDDLWSRASVQERGWLTEPQRAQLDTINERIGAIHVQMAECAEEF